MSNPTIDNLGNKRWYNDKKELHRIEKNSRGEVLPAVENTNGDKVWYVDNKRHRTDGPAIDYTKGYKKWSIDGKCHRTDGPAVEYPNGTKEYHINNRQITSIKN